MPVYALATLPLIRRAQSWDLVQSWFADDAGAGASLFALATWWSVLQNEGPKFRYFVYPHKTWLLVKPEHADRATQLFQDIGIKITTQGCPLLGSPRL